MIHMGDSDIMDMTNLFGAAAVGQGKVMARRRLGAAAAGLVLAFLPRFASAQTIPIEEKARYERSLEARVDTVLRKVLGPGRAEVVVEAVVDFTRIEKYEVKEGSRTVQSGDYLWGSEPAAAQKELLPGIASDDPMPAGHAAQPHPTSYERVNTYPSNFVKRLTVTLLLDRTLTDHQVEDVKAMVSEVMALQPARGDALTLVRADFAPPWKTIWREPEMAGLAVKYLIISLLSLLTLVVVGVSFMRLATAMNTMAKAQSEQLTMEMKSLPDMSGAGGDADGGQEIGELSGPKAGEAAGASAAQIGNEVVFDVGLEQLEPFAEMVASEDAANVALIAAHLRPEIRKAFFEMLPIERRSAIATAMGRIRFLESDMILNLKEEVERRLNGAVGGIARLVDAIEAAPIDKRADMLSEIERLDPELARRARRHILLFEDLRRLRPGDWGMLSARVPFEIWADAIGAQPDPAIAEGLSAHLPAAGWKLLSQMASMSKVDAQTQEAARSKVLSVLAEMIASGAIVRPSSQPAGAEALPSKEPRL
jgi:flagellar motor switch protein FliG